MSVFTDRLVSTSSKDARLRVSIDGIPIAFEAASTVAAPAAPALDGRGMLVSVDESRTTLDRRQRLQIGGGFSCVLQDRGTTLRSLFAVRSYRVTYVRSNTAASATTLPVADTSTLPSSGYVYVGSETIQYTGKTLTTLTGCTRGALGSRAVAHRGGSDQGMSVFTTPPTYVGRRVRLDGYFNDDDGKADLSTLTRLGTYRLEESPRDMGDGRWELRCSHLSDELAKRKIGTGLVDVKPEGSTTGFVNVAGVDYLEITLPEGGARMFTPAAVQTYALVTFSGTSAAGTGVFAIVSVTGNVLRLSTKNEVASGSALADLVRLVASLDRIISFDFGGIVGGSAQAERDRIGTLTVDSVKHICIVQGEQPTTLARYVLESQYGSGVGNDKLPGIAPSTLGGAGFRFGAAIPAAEIDYTSLQSLSVSSSWSWVIDEELPLVDFLEDLCREADCAAIFDADGKLVFRQLVSARTGSTTIAEADVKGVITSTFEEQNVLSRVRLECNYDPVSGEYEGTVDVIDEELAATYSQVEGSLVIQSRAIVVDPVATGDGGTLVRPTVPSADLLPTLRRTMLGSRTGGLLLTFTASPKHFGVALGDDVAINFPSVSDYRGATLAGGRGRVIERKPDLASFEVELTVAVEDPTYYFATSAVVTSVAGANVTVSSTDFGTSTTPLVGRFRVSDIYRVYNPTTNAVVGDGLQITSVDIVNPNLVTVVDVNAGAPSLASLASGFVLLLVSGNGTADDGFAMADFSYFDINNYTGVTTRWR